MAYIDADEFFATVKRGQRFRFAMRPDTHEDIDAGLIMLCTAAARTLTAHMDGGLHVPFLYPLMSMRGDGAFWRSACDDLLFEILP